LHRRADGEDDPRALGAGRRPGGAVGVPDGPGQGGGGGGAFGLRAGVPVSWGAQRGAESVAGGRRGDGAAHGPLLPEPAGRRDGKDAGNEQGGGAARGEGVAARPERQAGASGGQASAEGQGGEAGA